MKKVQRLILVFVLIPIGVFFLLAAQSYAATSITENITVDTIWGPSNGPFIIENTIMIESGVTLTILPGTIIKSTGGLLSIEGGIHAVGTIENPIVFTAMDDPVGEEENSELPPGMYWQGIQLLSSPSPTRKFQHVAFRYAQKSIRALNTSVSISDSSFAQSGIEADSSEIAMTNVHFSDLYEVAVLLKNNATGAIKRCTIVTTTGSAVVVFYQSTLTIEDCTIENNNLTWRLRDQIDVFAGGTLYIKNSMIRGGDDGIGIFAGGKLIADNITVTGAQNAGISSYGHSNQPMNVLSITNSLITQNPIGIFPFARTEIEDISNNSIIQNVIGVKVYNDSPLLNFSHNWWGDASGPYHQTLNPGGLGNGVSDNIAVSPWLQSDPRIELAGVSNVLFIPGFQASRLYTKGSIINPEDQLWEPNNNADVRDLAMNAQGASVDPGIYTKDIILKANAVPIVSMPNIYKDFASSLDALVSEGDMAAWAPVPYDW